MTRFTATSTHKEKYEPAITIADQADADAYFEELVEYQMLYGNPERAKAEEIERTNLGYFAGYFDHGTRLRVERLFHCKHPVFGLAEDGAPVLPLAAMAHGAADAEADRKSFR